MKMSAIAVYIIILTVLLQYIATCTHSNNTSTNRPSKQATTATTHPSKAMEPLPDDSNESGSDIDNDSDNDLTEDDDEDATIPHR